MKKLIDWIVPEIDAVIAVVGAPFRLLGRWLERLSKTKTGKLLLFGDTRLLRFWLALCSMFFSVWVLFDKDYASGHQEAVSLVSEHAQVVLFAVHGIAVMYGVLTGRFNTILLLCEGLLGAFLWLGLGLAETIHQGTPGPMLVAGTMSLFLLIRYPTHYGVVDES